MARAFPTALESIELTRGTIQLSSASENALASACHKRWDVLVIGGGLAGTMAAIRTASSGLRTLLVDRKPFPRFKVCGACLNQRALDAFSQAGLDSVISQLPAASLHDLRVASPRVSAVIPLAHQSLAIARSDLDWSLVQAATGLGATFLPASLATIQKTDRQAPTRTVMLRQGDQSASVDATVVIVADGLAQSSLRELPDFNSRVASHSRVGIGGIIDAHDEDSATHAAYGSGSIHMAVGKTGYVGVVRLADGTLNVAAACDVGALKQCANKADMIAGLINEAGMIVPDGLGSTEWIGTTGLTRTANRVAGHRLLLVGDSGGYVEPFTGEGMAWAATSGQAAADFCVDSWEQMCRSWSQSVENQWSQQHARLVRRRQRWCRGIARLLRNPRLVDVTLQAANRFPALVKPVLQHLNAPAGRDNRGGAERVAAENLAFDTPGVGVPTHSPSTNASTRR